MAENSFFTYNGWTVDVDSGKYWHSQEACPRRDWFTVTSRMKLGCTPARCTKCNETVPAATFERLYQAWRLFHIRDRYIYVSNSFYINGILNLVTKNMADKIGVLK